MIIFMGWDNTRLDNRPAILREMIRRHTMSDSSKNFDQSCHQDCESAYQSCLRSKEHDSVCKMKHAQCACGCVIEY